MEIKCTNCDCVEFVSKPNRYDIYKSNEGKLERIESSFTNEEIKLFCRECGEELKNSTDLVSE